MSAPELAASIWKALIQKEPTLELARFHDKINTDKQLKETWQLPDDLTEPDNAAAYHAFADHVNILYNGDTLKDLKDQEATAVDWVTKEAPQREFIVALTSVFWPDKMKITRPDDGWDWGTGTGWHMGLRDPGHGKAPEYVWTPISDQWTAEQLAEKWPEEWVTEQPKAPAPPVQLPIEGDEPLTKLKGWEERKEYSNWRFRVTSDGYLFKPPGGDWQKETPGTATSEKLLHDWINALWAETTRSLDPSITQREDFLAWWRRQARAKAQSLTE
ncbi:hypothetical protein [Streptomyces sp. NPDC055085]